MATKGSEHHQGSVKDPEHDGRLKENREAGQTKGTTAASASRAKDHGHEAAHTSTTHAGEKSHAGSSSTASKAEAAPKGGSEADDMKAREYTDAQGNVHHHTKAYMEGHAKK